MNKTKQYKKLSAAKLINSSALGLSLVSPGALAIDFIEQPSLDIKIAHYEEDDADIVGDGERYEIPSINAAVAIPLSSNHILSMLVDYETMSGASPYYLASSDNGNDALLVMSGASKIEDERLDVQIGLQQGNRQTGHALHLGRSHEDDYESTNIGYQRWLALDDSDSILSLGLAYAYDEIEPVKDWAARNIDKDYKDSLHASASLAFILNANSAFKSSLNASFEKGYLSDPYKKVEINNAVVADQRPEERSAIAWLNQYRYYIDSFDAALHLDYRFYLDSWDIHSHTFTMRWAQHLGDHWLITPELRYYTQTAAEFYAPFFFSQPGDNHHSADYRLSPYGAISGKINLHTSIDDIELRLSYERYLSDSSYALESVDFENPALVDFNIVSFGVNKKF